MKKRTPPGSVWRVKYDVAPKRRGGMYGDDHHLLSADYPQSPLGDGKRYQRVRKRTIIDEVCIDDWLHVEQMDNNVWWLRLGDKMVNITVRKGKVTLGEWYE